MKPAVAKALAGNLAPCACWLPNRSREAAKVGTEGKPRCAERSGALPRQRRDFPTLSGPSISVLFVMEMCPGTQTAKL